MKLIKLFITALIVTISPFVYANKAATCASDTNEMMAQIYNYGSITTPDGRHRFTQVGEATVFDDDHCTAKGLNFGHVICRISWERGNWGNTFHCV